MDANLILKSVYCGDLELHLGDVVEVVDIDIGIITGNVVGFSDSFINVLIPSGLHFQIYYSDIFSIEKVV